MSYDLYVAFGGASTQDVDARVTGMAARGRKDEEAVSDYKNLVRKDVCAHLDMLAILRPSPDLERLPAGSAFLQFDFTLAKPYLSKDDDPFYVADSVNPVRKEKVFKVPMAAASSWKGLLRWTAMQIRLVEKRDELSDEQFASERLALSLLFGDEKGEEPGEARDVADFLDRLRPAAKESFRQSVKEHFSVDAGKPMPHYSGRVLCYPTFFDRIDVEVINPHSRQTKAGTHPIYLECVPAGAKGTLCLLYVPFDLIGRADAEAICRESRQDLLIVAEAVRAMMLLYGFSAKRTSGYGTAEDRVENGRLTLHDPALAEGAKPAPAAPAPAPPAQSLPRYLAAPGQLKPEYLNPDGTFRERTEAELKAMKKADRQEYDKAKKWWEREGRRQEVEAAPPEAPPPVEKPTTSLASRTFEFNSLSELVERAREIAAS